MDNDLRDRLANIIRDEATTPAPSKRVLQSASHGGININGAQGPVAIHLVAGRRESALQRRMRHFRWRTRWLVGSLAVCAGLSYVALFYLSVMPYMDAGYGFIESLQLGTAAGITLPELMTRALLVGIPTGLLVFSIFLATTWQADAPEPSH